jgi:hypothetical protein
MRQLLFLSLIMVSAAFMECSSQPPKSPRVSAEGKDVKVDYGQPSKRGRVIFGQLEPYGKVWRTGANEATEITFKKDVTFGGQYRQEPIRCLQFQMKMNGRLFSILS